MVHLLWGKLYTWESFIDFLTLLTAKHFVTSCMPSFISYPFGNGTYFRRERFLLGNKFFFFKDRLLIIRKANIFDSWPFCRCIFSPKHICAGNHFVSKHESMIRPYRPKQILRPLISSTFLSSCFYTCALMHYSF